jgi:ABC-type nickel/cobalt efflux system permease component RcnA
LQDRHQLEALGLPGNLKWAALALLLVAGAAVGGWSVYKYVGHADSHDTHEEASKDPHKADHQDGHSEAKKDGHQDAHKDDHKDDHKSDHKDDHKDEHKDAHEIASVRARIMPSS